MSSSHISSSSNPNSFLSDSQQDHFSKSSSNASGDEQPIPASIRPASASSASMPSSASYSATPLDAVEVSKIVGAAGAALPMTAVAMTAAAAASQSLVEDGYPLHENLLEDAKGRLEAKMKISRTLGITGNDIKKHFGEYLKKNQQSSYIFCAIGNTADSILAPRDKLPHEREEDLKLCIFVEDEFDLKNVFIRIFPNSRGNKEVVKTNFLTDDAGVRYGALLQFGSIHITLIFNLKSLKPGCGLTRNIAVGTHSNFIDIERETAFLINGNQFYAAHKDHPCLLEAHRCELADMSITHNAFYQLLSSLNGGWVIESLGESVQKAFGRKHLDQSMDVSMSKVTYSASGCKDFTFFNLMTIACYSTDEQIKELMGVWRNTAKNKYFNDVAQLVMVAPSLKKEILVLLQVALVYEISLGDSSIKKIGPTFYFGDSSKFYFTPQSDGIFIDQWEQSWETTAANGQLNPEALSSIFNGKIPFNHSGKQQIQETLALFDGEADPELKKRLKPLWEMKWQNHECPMSLVSLLLRPLITNRGDSDSAIYKNIFESVFKLIPSLVSSGILSGEKQEEIQSLLVEHFYFNEAKPQFQANFIALALVLIESSFPLSKTLKNSIYTFALKQEMGVKSHVLKKLFFIPGFDIDRKFEIFCMIILSKDRFEYVSNQELLNMGLELAFAEGGVNVFKKCADLFSKFNDEIQFSSFGKQQIQEIFSIFNEEVNEEVKLRLKPLWEMKWQCPEAPAPLSYLSLLSKQLLANRIDSDSVIYKSVFEHFFKLMTFSSISDTLSKEEKVGIQELSLVYFEANALKPHFQSELISLAFTLIKSPSPLSKTLKNLIFVFSLKQEIGVQSLLLKRLFSLSGFDTDKKFDIFSRIITSKQPSEHISEEECLAMGLRLALETVAGGEQAVNKRLKFFSELQTFLAKAKTPPNVVEFKKVLSGILALDTKNPLMHSLLIFGMSLIGPKDDEIQQMLIGAVKLSSKFDKKFKNDTFIPFLKKWEPSEEHGASLLKMAIQCGLKDCVRVVNIKASFKVRLENAIKASDLKVFDELFVEFQNGVLSLDNIWELINAAFMVPVFADKQCLLLPTIEKSIKSGLLDPGLKAFLDSLPKKIVGSPHASSLTSAKKILTVLIEELRKIPDEEEKADFDEKKKSISDPSSKLDVTCKKIFGEIVRSTSLNPLSREIILELKAFSTVQIKGVNLFPPSIFMTALKNYVRTNAKTVIGDTPIVEILNELAGANSEEISKLIELIFLSSVPDPKHFVSYNIFLSCVPDPKHCVNYNTLICHLKNE